MIKRVIISIVTLVVIASFFANGGIVLVSDMLGFPRIFATLLIVFLGLIPTMSVFMGTISLKKRVMRADWLKKKPKLQWMVLKIKLTIEEIGDWLNSNNHVGNYLRRLLQSITKFLFTLFRTEWLLWIFSFLPLIPFVGDICVAGLAIHRDKRPVTASIFVVIGSVFRSYISYYLIWSKWGL